MFDEWKPISGNVQYIKKSLFSINQIKVIKQKSAFTHLHANLILNESFSTNKKKKVKLLTLMIFCKKQSTQKLVN